MATRPTVYIKLDEDLKEVPFDKCVLNILGWPKKISYTCDSKGNITLLNDKNNSNIHLRHSALCPVNPVGRCEPIVTSSNRRHQLSIGATVFLISSDGYLLITRRSKHLKLFPGVWVLPGGHVEEGETFLHAAIRELAEETGIELKSEEYNAKELMIFESCFPPFREHGPTKRRHLILIYEITCGVPLEDLKARIDLDENETDSCIWVHRNSFQDIISGCNDVKVMETSEQYMKSNGKISYKKMDTSLLTKNIYETSDEHTIVERLSTATYTAIQVYKEDNDEKR